MNFSLPLLTNDSKATVSVLYCTLSRVTREGNTMDQITYTLEEVMMMLKRSQNKLQALEESCAANTKKFIAQQEYYDEMTKIGMSHYEENALRMAIYESYHESLGIQEEQRVVNAEIEWCNNILQNGDLYMQNNNAENHKRRRTGV